jgi:hypothetical protein
MIDAVEPVRREIPLDEYEHLLREAAALGKIILARKDFVASLDGDNDDLLAWKFLYRLDLILKERADGVNRG